MNVNVGENLPAELIEYLTNPEKYSLRYNDNYEIRLFKNDEFILILRLCYYNSSILNLDEPKKQKGYYIFSYVKSVGSVISLDNKSNLENIIDINSCDEMILSKKCLIEFDLATQVVYDTIKTGRLSNKIKWIFEGDFSLYN